MTKALEEIGREDLKEEGVSLHLGVLAARSLYLYGSVVFCLDDGGKVVQANPLHVYLAPDAIVPDNKRTIEWVRPVIGNGTPRFAAWRDGVLWEVRRSDEEQTESS